MPEPPSAAPARSLIKYVLFFDENMLRHRLVPHLNYLRRRRVGLIFFSGSTRKKNIFNKKLPVRGMNDDDLLEYTMKVAQRYYKSAICFFFTFDGKILKNIRQDHPARYCIRIISLKQRNRSRAKELAEEIIKIFEKEIEKLEGAAPA